MSLLFQNKKSLKKKPLIVDINFPDYSYEFCPTESSVNGTLLYIRNNLSYKLGKD